MKRVFIVHGYGGNPDSNWFPWLKAKLEHVDIVVDVPVMPNTDAPELSQWLLHLQKVVGQLNEETYFVGHSLGCPTILRFLENLNGGEKVGGVVLVAGFAEPIHFTELDGFTDSSWNDARIQAACNNIVLISSDNDPHVPLVMAERMQDRFNAELVVMPDAKHINGDAGYKELPLIFTELVKIMNQS